MIKRKKFSESRRNNRLGKVKKVKKSLEDHKKTYDALLKIKEKIAI